MNLSTSMTMELRGTATDTADLVDTAPRSVILGQLITLLVDGTGSGSANQVYSNRNTILAAATNTVDLFGTVTDVFGATVSFSVVKGLYFKNTSTTAAVLELGGGSNGLGLNAFDTFITSNAADGSEAIIVRAGGAVMLWTPDATGYACAAGSDILGITETATLAGSYDLVVVGEV